MQQKNKIQSNSTYTPTFTAKFQVAGSIQDLKNIRKQFSKIIYGDKSKPLNERGPKLGDYAHININGGKSHTDLFCTKEHAEELKNYFVSQKVHMSIVNTEEFIAKVHNELSNCLDMSENNDVVLNIMKSINPSTRKNTFQKEILPKFVGDLINIPILQAKEVLKALKTKSFNVLEGIIIKN